MSELGRYYIFASLLFLLDMICDILFYSSFSSCEVSTNAATIFLVLILINAFLFFFMFLDGLLINYYSNLDPADLKAMGMIKNWVGIFAKFAPTLNKLLHLFKLLIFFILTIFVVVAVVGEVTISNYTEESCGSGGETKKIDSYKSQVIIFYGIEAFSMCFALCVLGVIRNYITEEGYLYTPLPPDSGSFRKTFFKTFGP
mmetsp:Transcript_2721/g.2790  ORF Transcript_2721/g.2790 Transcript_2721/m.2790 type:complete len:200 (+) Transcript_2721:12-611(+)